MTVFNYQHLYLYTEANLLRKQMVSLPINAHILHHKQPLHNLSSSSQRHKPTEYNKYRQYRKYRWIEFCVCYGYA